MTTDDHSALDEQHLEQDAAIATEADESAAAVADPDRHWYVVHTQSGYENSVKRNLEHRITSMDVADKIFSVIVPTEEEIEVKDGARRTVHKKVYPGYILVEMKLDPQSWYVVRNTPRVTGFIGGDNPVALEADEVKRIVTRKTEVPKVKVGFQKGQSVRVIDGPFTEFVGLVDDIDQEKGKVRVMVSFFGRETPVTLDFLQVEKL